MAAPLIILEGGDCAGKTTLAEDLMSVLGTNAHYVHYSDMKHVKHSLPRMYVEGMMPAFLGHKPVIMDRCWLSEEPYCRAFRPDESPRLDDADMRMLERFALTMNPLVVYCDPGWDEVVKHFEARKGEEYLDNADQLKMVREGYGKVLRRSHLNAVKYNWKESEPGQMTKALIDRIEIVGDDLRDTMLLPGVGSTRATVLVVAEDIETHQEFDPHFQWPYASFSHHGTSRWLATQFDRCKIDESNLWWVTEEMLDDEVVDELLDKLPINHVVCLGVKALEKAKKYIHDHVHYVNHPALWKESKPVWKNYEGAELIKELTG